MRPQCQEIQVKIVSVGAKAAHADPEIRRHVESCPLCAEFMLSAGELHEVENELLEYDAPDSLVAKTIETIKKHREAEYLESQAAKKPEPRSWWQFLCNPVLTPALVAVFCGVIIVKLAWQENGKITLERAKAPAPQTAGASMDMGRQVQQPSEAETKLEDAAVAESPKAVGGAEMLKEQASQLMAPLQKPASAPATLRDAAQAVRRGDFALAKGILVQHQPAELSRANDSARLELAPQRAMAPAAAKGGDSDRVTITKLLTELALFDTPGHGTPEERDVLARKIERFAEAE